MKGEVSPPVRPRGRGEPAFAPWNVRAISQSLDSRVCGNERGGDALGPSAGFLTRSWPAAREFPQSVLRIRLRLVSATADSARLGSHAATNAVTRGLDPRVHSLSRRAFSAVCSRSNLSGLKAGTGVDLPVLKAKTSVGDGVRIRCRSRQSRGR